MSEQLPPGWRSSLLSEVVPRADYGVSVPLEEGEHGIPVLRMNNLREGRIDVSEIKRSSDPLALSLSLRAGDVLFNRTNSLDHVGKTALWRGELEDASFASYLVRLVPDTDRLDPEYLVNWLNLPEIQLLIRRFATPGVHQVNINPTNLRRVSITLPDDTDEQRRIATILTTLDEVIEATEKLVEKHQQMKAGLMHDLFTRGLWTRPELARGDHKGLPCEATAQEGQLRPTPDEAPGLYQDSPLGLIPKAWKLSSIGSIVESLADGPFGSNLKTEHYVEEPGVRVVRLQNIQNTRYNDEDRAFVSQSHANYLIRNQVGSGDVLVAGLGEDSHVVARACCYPEGLPPAINKADCFRLRCKPEKALNAFVMFYLNTSIARGQVRRYEQGVTRRRINGGNLKRVLLGLPSPHEQDQCVGMLDAAGTDIDSINDQIAKLRQQKQGLMQDLLTGRVRVAADSQTAI